MTELSTRNFGLLVAYVLPGLVALAGIGRYWPTIRAWFGTSPSDAPTVAGFLFVTLASVAAGMTVSVIRWLLLDWLHHHTGIPRPDWDFSRLQPNLAAFYAVVENHYRYYQFYGNMLVAVAIVAATQLSPKATITLPLLVLVGAAGLLYVASRDALRKYYSRTRALLGVTQTDERRIAMTNGFGPKHSQTDTGSNTTRRQANLATQKATRPKPPQNEPKKKTT